MPPLLVRAKWVAGWFCAAGVTVGSARAEEATAAGASDGEEVVASLEYVAPPDCGSAADLTARIARRSDRIRIERAEQTRALRVEIALDDDVFVVTIGLTQPSGRRSSRVLRAPTCDEAIEATALVAALSLDPSASSAPESELAQVTKDPEPFASPATAKSDGGTETRSRDVTADAQNDLSRGAETKSFTGSLGILAEGLWAPAPSVLPGVGLAAYVRYETGEVFSPALRLGFAHFGGGGFAPAEGVGAASIQLDEGTLELCPIRLGSSRFSLAPCPALSGGRLLVSGSEALEARSFSRPWWTAGGTLLGSARVAGSIELHALFSIAIPLIRDTYQFDPGSAGHVVHSVPGVALRAGLGAGLWFP